MGSVGSVESYLLSASYKKLSSTTPERIGSVWWGAQKLTPGVSLRPQTTTSGIVLLLVLVCHGVAVTPLFSYKNKILEEALWSIILISVE